MSNLSDTLRGWPTSQNYLPCLAPPLPGTVIAPSVARRRPTVPAVEPMEPRVLLATFTVQSTAGRRQFGNAQVGAFPGQFRQGARHDSVRYPGVWRPAHHPHQSAAADHHCRDDRRHEPARLCRIAARSRLMGRNRGLHSDGLVLSAWREPCSGTGDHRVFGRGASSWKTAGETRCWATSWARPPRERRPTRTGKGSRSSARR